MKAIAKLVVFLGTVLTFSLANAYPACSGTAVSQCSGLSQSACGGSYIKAITYTGCTSCTSAGYCNTDQRKPGNVTCTQPGVQCKWSGSSCSDGGAYCQ